MIQALGEYVRNIAVFLLFTSFIGIIMPSGKYKGYVNLVLGFMLIFIVLAPLVNMGAASFDDALMELNIAMGVSDGSLGATHGEMEERRIELITENVQQSLKIQLEHPLSELGFRVNDINITLGENYEILGMELHLADLEEAEEQGGLIRVERIRVNRDEPVKDPRVLDVINFIENFYNLPSGTVVVRLS